MSRSTRSYAGAGSGGPLLHMLRAAVRGTTYGVLISAGCVLHTIRCLQGPGHESGAYLVVQPCDVNGRPRGFAIGIGPVLTDADAQAVAD
jgi:hypothetical protein